MKKITLLIFVSMLISHFALAEQTTYNDEKAVIKKDLSLEYAKKLGFKKGQILNMEIVDDSTMKVYVDECSFCGVFRNAKARNDIAHKTLDWFLNKTGYKKGNVEWYNSNKIIIMSISGSLSASEIKLGPSCSIK
ncbi:MAG: hypothetical protein JRJ02_02605 [Deltaproteobacteria bacterium]|nr:hypothetical protein [Deltaproteobacteria bacterium]